MSRKWIVLMLVVAGFTMSLGACSPVKFEGPKACTENCGGITPTGSPGPARTVKQTVTLGQTSNKVDILFVVDNSGSMEPEQQVMGTRFPDFISSLSGLDWRLGIVTTDMSGDGPLKNGHLIQFNGAPGGTYFIDSSTTDVQSVFNNTVQINVNVAGGFSGSGDERGIYAAITAMNSKERGFFRDGAKLAVVILSDEDERSEGGSVVGSNPLEAGRDFPDDFISTARSAFRDDKSATVHSIVTNDEACDAIQDAQTIIDAKGDRYTKTGFIGHKYMELSRKTGGKVGSICSDNYGAQLQEIGSIIQITQNSVTLECTPNGEVKASWTPNQNLTFSKSGNKIYFSPDPQVGTTVTLEYTCGG